jgi:hypothetical protein
MDPQTAETVTDRLHDDVGDDLRAVARGRPTADEMAYEVTYLHDDVGERYTEAMRDRIFEEFVAEYYRRGWEEDLFQPLGRLDHSVQILERGVNVVAWGDGGFLFVSTERDATTLPRVVSVLDEVCRASGR